MTQLCDLSARTLRSMIGSRQISPVELLASCRARIDALNPAVNAIVATCWERAESEARAAEQAVMAGDALGILHGLPVAIKDLDDTEGLVTTYGSALFKDHVPAADEYCVANIRRAGGIVVGKTNVPMFGMGTNSTNDIYGATGNPFDPTLIAGGSSGGSAAAMATGMVPLCSASDSGGSTRMPAAYCGVVGLRQTAGIVPQPTRTMTWSHYPIKGPMGRDVGDTALLLSAMAGYDTRDPFSSDMDPAIWRDPPQVDLPSLRAAFSEDFGFAMVSRPIRETFRKRLADLSPMFRLCAEDTPEVLHADETYDILRSMTTVNYVGALYEKHGDLIGENNVSQLKRAYGISGKEIAFVMGAQSRLYRAFHAFFERYDLLITPTVAAAPYPNGQLNRQEVEGEKTQHFMHANGLSYAVTLTGFPSITIPCGLEPSGTPFHLQIVAGKNRDHFLLGAAQSLMDHLARDPQTARPIPPMVRELWSR